MTVQMLAFQFPPAGLIAVRILVIVASLALWFITQKLLARRNPAIDAAVEAEIPAAGLPDGIHFLTRHLHRRLLNAPKAADVLLVSSSAVIDVLGIGLIVASICGTTFSAFVGLIILFALRQVFQMLCPLPAPDGMIWRSPGVPTILVTYKTANDLFFSGHTAIAVFGGLWLGDAFGPIGLAVGITVMIFEIGVVLLLRAHYTMDVYAGLITALLIHAFTSTVGARIDQLFASLLHSF